MMRSLESDSSHMLKYSEILEYAKGSASLAALLLLMYKRGRSDVLLEVSCMLGRESLEALR